MTDNERANKVYLARLKYGDGKPRKFIHELPLPKHDISVGRKTPKSDYLKQIDAFSKSEKKYVITGLSGQIEINQWSEMIDVYVGNK